MSDAVERLRSGWDRYWFEPDAPLNLALARVLAAGVALWILCSRDFAAVSDLPLLYWEGVATEVRWRFLVFPGNGPLESVLLWAARLGALLALVGVFPRAASFATALLLYHLAPMDGIIWSTSPTARGLTIPLLALLLCAAAPSDRRLTTYPRRSPSARSWEFGWPLRLLQLFLVQVYFFSGVAKLQDSGLGWAAAENVRNWLLLATQNPDVAVHTALGGWVASSAALSGAVGWATILFEIGFLFALFRWRGRTLLVGAAIAFHAGIYFAMNITFNSWPLLLVFVDWDALVTRLDRGPGR